MSSNVCSRSIFRESPISAKPNKAIIYGRFRIGRITEAVT
jgi:hypothetical protein